ncbi:MAG: M43 family zinc metalloprotease [Bacteroidia bacterium]|nr:M43 family zinc metalloprotease [Bacteroidia bacterium]
MRKIYLIVAAGISVGLMFAQSGRKATFTKATSATPATMVQEQPIKRTCGTVAPPVEWEEQFQKLIEQYVKDHPEIMNGRVYTNYTIPIVFHVVHGGQAIGTYPNLAQGQINSQVQVLNADYSGTGLNVGNYPSNAFVNYAASLPAANKDANGRVKIANTGIQFCLATKDPNGNTLAEPGIDRINYVSKGWSNPASFTSVSAFQSFIDGTVKPNTIWDPTRYFNVWVTDVSTSVGLLGYATFPAGTGLTGLSGFGTATTDGVWIWAKACGSKNIYPSGTYAAPYDKGRTLTHEAGHWLGLRHIWGDGTCATDYCADTPPAQTSNNGCPTYPYHVGTCSGNSPDGEMFMNFMDYTDDACMYMFTVDQTTRMQTAMANGTYRSQLTASSATLCGSSSPAANACFTMPSTGCINTAINLTNCSTGSPTPTYTWTANPNTGVTFNPNQNATNPSVTFANTGSYTITLTASNGTVSTSSHVISISSCVTQTVCNDTITNIRNTDTLVAYTLPTSTACTTGGFISGNNCYGDLEKAEFFAPSTYTQVQPAQFITGVIVLFYKNGNVGTGGSSTGRVDMTIYNGDGTSGPGTAVATVTANLGMITAGTPTTKVTYCGDPNLGYSQPIILPYKYTFTTPVGPLSSSTPNGFFASVVLPTTSGDTAVIFNNTIGSNPTNTMWEKWNTNAWYAYNDATNSWGIDLNGAILPILTCTTGKDEISTFANNIMIVPNPSNGIFNIVTTFNEKQNIKFEVMNTLGQVLNSGEFQNVMSNHLTINLSNYQNGIYFLRITNGSETLVKRIVINK